MIDLYSGVGIGAAGFKKAGFRIVAAVDVDGDASKVYEKNIGVKPIVGSLRVVKGPQILREAGLKRGEAWAVSGCPPCQSWSSLRRTTEVKGKRDSRKSLLKVFADRVEEILPRVVILENVSGLAGTGNRMALSSFIRRMRKLGYDPDFGILDAQEYGVAQRRRRFIFLGVRGGKAKLPKPTHSKDGSDRKPRVVKVAERIGDLPALESGEKSTNDPLHFAPRHSEEVLKLMAKIPKDGGSRSALQRSDWLECHKRLKDGGSGSVYGRLAWEDVAPTMTTRATTPACGRFTHPEQDRGLTLREVARLQSVDDSFEFEGTSSQIGRWIGNGLPTLLAERIGRKALVLAKGAVVRDSH